LTLFQSIYVFVCFSILMNIIQVPIEVVHYRQWVQENFRYPTFPNGTLLPVMELFRPSMPELAKPPTPPEFLLAMDTPSLPSTDVAVPPTPSPSPPNNGDCE
jgi:hypothetical protein